MPCPDTESDEEVLDPREVAHGEGDLGIYGVDDAGEHSGADHRHVGGLAVSPESLVVEDDDVEKEDDKGTIEAVSHPPDDSVPIEEEVSGSLLI